MKIQYLKNNTLLNHNKNNQYLSEDEYSFDQLISDVSLKEYSEYAGFSLMSILLKESEYRTQAGDNGSNTDYTIKAIAMLCNPSDGAISYLQVYPHYRIRPNDVQNFPYDCDDVIIRFTIRRDRKGYFKPLWISCCFGDEEYAPYQSEKTRIKYLGPSLLTYKGFNVKKALGSDAEKKESIRLAIIEWIQENSRREVVADPMCSH